MQAISASNTLAAPKVVARNLSARRTVKALAPRCVLRFIRVLDKWRAGTILSHDSRVDLPVSSCLPK